MTKYAVDIVWDKTAPIDLPTLTGPFDTEAEASDFIRTSVPNGKATVRALCYPYMRGNHA